MYQFSYAEIQIRLSCRMRGIGKSSCCPARSTCSPARAKPGSSPARPLGGPAVRQPRLDPFRRGDLGSPDNALPKELRANLISIGLWLLREAERGSPSGALRQCPRA